MNYFDDYYSDSEPKQEQPNYIPFEPKAPKARKERKGLRRVISVLLVLALVIGSCGATAALMNHQFKKQMQTLTQEMNDKIAAIQKNAGQGTAQGPAASGRPLSSGEYLTPGQVYERNVNAVVAITVEVESNNYKGGRKWLKKS